jgi:hypothetical protein
MAIRAENDPKFSRRFLYMGIAAIGFSIYCLVDGSIRYPHKQERAVAFEKLYSEGKADQWEAFATERGWSTSIPEESKSEEDFKTSIVLQYSMFVVTGLIGMWLISIPLRARGRWIESTGSGIASSWGQSFNYDQVENVEKRQWRSKGIARVTYVDNGRRRRFVIDDYKYDRYKTDAILYELEQNIDPERITGGPPDPPPGSDEVAEADVDQAAIETK